MVAYDGQICFPRRVARAAAAFGRALFATSFIEPAMSAERTP